MKEGKILEVLESTLAKSWIKRFNNTSDLRGKTKNLIFTTFNNFSVKIGQKLRKNTEKLNNNNKKRSNIQKISNLHNSVEKRNSKKSFLLYVLRKNSFEYIVSPHTKVDRNIKVPANSLVMINVAEEEICA